MTMAGLIDLTSSRLSNEPFPHFTATSSIGRGHMLALLDWFESVAVWNLVKAGFYEQYELDLGVCASSAPLSFLVSEESLERVREETRLSFGRPFVGPVGWTVHKLLPGQRIRMHNDSLKGGETHRVILHLNKGWDSSQGGFLMFFNSADPCDVSRVWMPLNGSVVGFEISDRSNHAVSLVISGERYAIVYSLNADE